LRDIAVPTAPDSELERWRLVYEQTGRTASVFWEWRHKIMLLAAATLGLAITAFSLLLRAEVEGWVKAVPLFAASFVIAACRTFHARNADILRTQDCIAVCDALERELVGQLTVKIDPPSTARARSRRAATCFFTPAATRRTRRRRGA